jgi:hypothetical protein
MKTRDMAWYASSQTPTVTIGKQFTRRLTCLRKISGRTPPTVSLSLHIPDHDAKFMSLFLPKSFHTFRHGKPTMEHHKTHEIFHVQRLLGHRNIQNTVIYTTLENSLFTAEDDELHVAVARTLEEACKLLKVGFEHVTEMDTVKLFRKPKRKIKPQDKR